MTKSCPEKEYKIPRILVASTSSNSGKTFFTCGLLNLLKQSGKSVRAFKCGPDYIDPMFHSRVLGIKSSNIDTFFTGPELTKTLFTEKCSHNEIAVIEGVMGLYDGMGCDSSKASAYDVAGVLECPVVLLVDASGISRSILALIKGFLDYDVHHLIKAIVLNRTSHSGAKMLIPAIEKEFPDLKVLGYVPKIKDAGFESRHLGLVLPDEINSINKKISLISDELQNTLDVKLLLETAESAPQLKANSPEHILGMESELRFEGLKIAVARDSAFCFYYEDNLNLLRKLGAEIEYFSPLVDSFLPECSGMILGGGYPELYAEKLSENKKMMKRIKELVEQGLPVLAECGGFMYLQQSLTYDGTYQMCGVLNGNTRYTDSLVRFGYALFEDVKSSVFGGEIRGHEFHYFDSDDNGEIFTARKPTGQKSWKCVQHYKNVIAGFPHFYYYSNPEFAVSFLNKAKEFSSQGRMV